MLTLPHGRPPFGITGPWRVAAMSTLVGTDPSSVWPRDASPWQSRPLVGSEEAHAGPASASFLWPTVRSYVR